MTQAPKRSPLLVWSVILALVAGGAAGAWYYWTHHYAIAKEPARSTPR